MKDLKKKKMKLTKTTLLKLTEKDLKAAVGGCCGSEKWD
jgi:hypothetical protein